MKPNGIIKALNARRKRDFNFYGKHLLRFLQTLCLNKLLDTSYNEKKRAKNYLCLQFFAQGII